MFLHRETKTGIEKKSAECKMALALGGFNFNMDNYSKKQIRTIRLIRNSSDLLRLVTRTGIEPMPSP